MTNSAKQSSLRRRTGLLRRWRWPRGGLVPIARVPSHAAQLIQTKG
jgi:hypothetical protein